MRRQLKLEADRSFARLDSVELTREAGTGLNMNKQDGRASEWGRVLVRLRGRRANYESGRVACTLSIVDKQGGCG